VEQFYRFVWNATIALSIGRISAAQGATALANIAPLSSVMRVAMTGISWNPGCPVPLDDLAAVLVKYTGFDGLTPDGTPIVNKRFAEEVWHIFTDLHDVHFPINKISPWENYGPDKYAEGKVSPDSKVFRIFARYDWLGAASTKTRRIICTFIRKRTAARSKSSSLSNPWRT
jgi:hypothetical protein